MCANALRQEEVCVDGGNRRESGEKQMVRLQGQTGPRDEDLINQDEGLNSFKDRGKPQKENIIRGTF